MSNKVLGCLTAGALAMTLAVASPALARGGGGMGGGMRGGGMGGGMHYSGMGGGPHVSGMSVGPQFSGSRFAGAPFAAHAAMSPRVSGFAFHDRGRFIHHRFHRFAFVGAPFAYAAYDSCWRRVWTQYGVQWVDVCSDYGYYGY
jgi:hypothetical protein